MPFRICVIGCGSLSTSAHGPSCRRYADRQPDVELAACCDLDAARAERYRESFGFGKAYSDFRAMLTTERPDAVCLMAPVSKTRERAHLNALSSRLPSSSCRSPGSPSSTGETTAASGTSS